MNILFASEYYFAHPDLVQLSKELAKKKHNISVITSFRTVDKETNEEVEIFEIKPFLTIHKIPHTLSFPLSKVRMIIQKRNIDVVHTINDGSTNEAAASLVAKATNRPFVYTIIGTGTRTGHLLVDSIVRLYFLTVERWIAKEAQRVLLLSQSLTSTADRLGIPRNKTIVIPSGIDTEYFSPERPAIKEKASRLKAELRIGDETTIGYVGRLFPAKGLTNLFSAVERIQGDYPDITLLIVGDGAQRNELEAIARRLKIRTIFAGWQRDVLPYYALMDIFVLPSLFEGLPNVILEAMAMKTAVIATEVGGNPDILTNEENGFLVPARDVQQLAHALEILVKDNDLRVKMGALNRQKVEQHFQWGQIANRIEKVYREIT